RVQDQVDGDVRRRQADGPQHRLGVLDGDEAAGEHPQQAVRLLPVDHGDDPAMPLLLHPVEQPDALAFHPLLLQERRQRRGDEADPEQLKKGHGARLLHQHAPGPTAPLRPACSGYRTTTFTGRPGTTITRATSLPFKNSCTLAEARAACRTVSSSASRGTRTRSRTFPFTCTTSSISASTTAAGSYWGQASRCTDDECPSISHASSATWGAKGASARTMSSRASRSAAGSC